MPKLVQGILVGRWHDYTELGPPGNARQQDPGSGKPDNEIDRPFAGAERAAREQARRLWPIRQRITMNNPTVIQCTRIAVRS